MGWQRSHRRRQLMLQCQRAGYRSNLRRLLCCILEHSAVSMLVRRHADVHLFVLHARVMSGTRSTKGRARIAQEEDSTLHERAVCHLFDTSLDCELLHHHMRALSAVHVETYFCRLDVELAPTMMAMVSLREMPALLLCRAAR